MPVNQAQLRSAQVVWSCLFGAFALAGCQPPIPVVACAGAADCTAEQRCDPVYGVCMPLPWDAARPDQPPSDAARVDRSTVDAGDPLVAWQWRVKLAFDNRSATEELIDFPVLVVLDGVRVRYADLAAGGTDLRFVDADDVTLLAHEVEAWDSSGRSFIWVRVPRVAAASSGDFIWLYYGNPAATSNESPVAVWSNHFRAVYHLGSDLVDSTAAAAPAVSHGAVIETAHIGSGARFAGSPTFIDLGPNLSAVQGIGACTISLWVKPAATGSGYLVSYSTHLPGNASRASVSLAGSNLQVWGRSIDEEGSQTYVTAGAGIVSGAWSHLAGTLDYPNDTVAAYVNGGFIGQGAVAFASPTTPHTPSANSALGAEDDGVGAHYDGVMDEVRLADVVRSASWIAAEYRSGRDDGFVIYGTPEAHERD